MLNGILVKLHGQTFRTLEHLEVIFKAGALHGILLKLQIGQAFGTLLHLEFIFKAGVLHDNLVKLHG